MLEILLFLFCLSKKLSRKINKHSKKEEENRGENRMVVACVFVLVFFSFLFILSSYLRPPGINTKNNINIREYK